MIDTIKTFLARRDAEADARLGIDATELRVREELGKKPEWDPVSNAEHAQVAEVLGDRAELEELQDDRRRLEDELARHPSRTGLLVLLGLTAVIEAFGGVLIMKSLGRENPERTFLGIALAVGTLGFTAFVSKTATDTVHTKDAGARRTLGSIALLAVYTVFVLAVAAARVELPEGEDGVDLLTYAEAILMVATTVLPAFTAEWIFRMRAPAVRAARALRNVRRRIRRLEAKHLRASAFARELSRERARFEQVKTRRGATHELARLRATARATEPKTTPTKSPAR